MRHFESLGGLCSIEITFSSHLFLWASSLNYFALNLCSIGVKLFPMITYEYSGIYSRIHSMKFIVRTVRITGSMSSVRAGGEGGELSDAHSPVVVSCARDDRMLPTCGMHVPAVMLYLKVKHL